MTANPDRKPSLDVVCHDTFDGIDAAQWNDLWQRMPQANIYQRYEWYSIWERHHRRSHPMKILTLHCEDRLVGAVALAICGQRRYGVARRKILTIASTHSSAYPLDQGPLIDPAFEEEVLEIMAEKIVKIDGFSVFQCELYEAGTAAERLLEAVARQSGRRMHAEILANSHLVELPESYDDFIAGLGYRTRRNIRSYQRRFLNGEGHEIRMAQTPEEMVELIESMREQKRSRYKERSRNSTLEDECFFGFLKDLGPVFLEKGWLLGWAATIADKIAATQFVFLDEHGHCYSYNSSFDTQHIKLRLHYVLENERFKVAIERGYGSMDLSTGHDEHKKLWSKGCVRPLLKGFVVLRPFGNATFWVLDLLKGGLKRERAKSLEANEPADSSGRS